MEKREKYEQIVRERERQRLEINQRKWSRKEEQEFYRTISTYGVEFDRLVTQPDLVIILSCVHLFLFVTVLHRIVNRVQASRIIIIQLLPTLNQL